MKKFKGYEVGFLIELMRNPTIKEKEKAKRLGIIPRTWRRWKKILKKKYSSKMNKNSSSGNDTKRYGKLNLSKSELLKLLALHDTKKEIADKLDVSSSTITRAMHEFNILTEEEKVRQLYNILDGENDSSRTITVGEKAQQEDRACFLCGDWHVGKEITKQNKTIWSLDIFEKASDKLIENALDLINNYISRASNFKVIDIFALGDFCDGSGEVYPGQAFDLEFGFPKQALSVYRTFLKMFKSFTEAGYKVNFHGVPGNHGSGSSNPEDNFDTLVYMFLADQVKRGNLENVCVEYAKKDFLNTAINGWKIHARHKAYKQNKTSAGRARYLGWSKNHKDADIIVSGHFHEPYKSATNGVESIINGALCPAGDFAEQLAVNSPPSQVLFGISKKRKTSWYYEVDLK